jgi:ankyrin repeat protein
MGTVDVMRCMVKELGADINEAHFNQNSSPLFHAAKAGRLDMVRGLSELGADVNELLRDGSTLLHALLLVSAMGGHLDVVRCLLLEFGADVNKSNSGIRGGTPLYCAVQNGRLDVIRCLVKHGADLNRATHEGITPLIVAAKKGRMETLRCLLELGADVAKSEKRGCTALYGAAEDGRHNMIRCLVEHGADLNQATHDGVTPLMAAAKFGHVEALRCLLELGADVAKAEIHGCTALYGAVQDGHHNIIRCLVEHNADVNHAIQNGQTPLMAAAANKDDKMVRYLIKHGANVQASTIYNANAVAFSELYGAPAVQTEYLEAKAHCSYPGCSGAGLKKCTGCKQVRYCGQACQLAHWKAHKTDCKTKKEA